MNREIALSMLDLVAVREGGTVADALGIALRTAQHAEGLGFVRYWLAEHHNMPGIASSATAVLVGHLAAGTSRIRVGSGGVMLPNHAPLVVAEAFGTLAELYPGRIDLGLGRAPGTDPLTMRALRRNRVETEADFPREVEELQQLLAPAQPRSTLDCLSRGRDASAHLVAGIQPVFGATCCSAWLAVCVCLALCTAHVVASRCVVPQSVSALSAVCQTLCGDWCARGGCAYRCAGAIPRKQYLPARAGHRDRAAQILATTR